MSLKDNTRLIIIILVLLITPFSITKAQNDVKERWSLEDCIEYALDNNLTVMQSEYNVDNSKVQFSQSKANMYPSANMGGSLTNFWGRSIDPTTNLFANQQIQSLGLNLRADYTLYGGSQRRNYVKRSRLDLAAAEYDLEKAKNDIMLDVTTAFLNVILNIELHGNAQLQLEITKAQLETTHKQVEAGALPYSNELDLIAQVESNEVQLINTENDVKMAYLRLKQLLLLPADTPFEIEMPDIENQIIELENVTPTEVYETAQSIMPEVKSVDLKVKSADMDVKISRGGMDPYLTAGGNMYSNYSSARKDRILSGEPTVQTVPIGYVVVPDPYNIQLPVFTDVEIPPTEEYTVGTQIKDNWSYSVSLSLYIPIFNGLQTRSQHQQAKILSEQSKILAQETRQGLRQTIETANANALAASKTYNASLKQVEALEESFRAAEKSYNLGAMNIYDYQVASNNLFQARSDLLRAKYNYIFTTKVLDFYLGKPLSLD